MEHVAQRGYEHELRVEVLVVVEEGVQLVREAELEQGLEVHELGGAVDALHRSLPAGHLLSRMGVVVVVVVVVIISDFRFSIFDIDVVIDIVIVFCRFLS